MVRGETKIACEISVTTEPEHESANDRKCLGAGATQVVVVSPSPAALKRIASAVRAACAEPDLQRVAFLSPTEIIAFLDEQGPAPEPEAKTVRGYKVKTTVEAGGGSPSKTTVGRTI